MFPTKILHQISNLINTPVASTVHLTTLNTFSRLIQSMAQWKHSTMSRCQRPAGACIWQFHLLHALHYNAHQIMRLNPNNDSLFSVWDDLGEEGGKYRGTVVGNDDRVYGIPYHATCIISSHPISWLVRWTCTVGTSIYACKRLTQTTNWRVGSWFPQTDSNTATHRASFLSKDTIYPCKKAYRQNKLKGRVVSFIKPPVCLYPSNCVWR